MALLCMDWMLSIIRVTSTSYKFTSKPLLEVKAKVSDEWRGKVEEWIEGMLGRSLTHKGDLFQSLRDGEVLCELIEKISPGVMGKYTKKKKNRITNSPAPLHAIVLVFFFRPLYLLNSCFLGEIDVVSKCVF